MYLRTMTLSVQRAFPTSDPQLEGCPPGQPIAQGMKVGMLVQDHAILQLHHPE
jgi:hypothetical protein